MAPPGFKDEIIALVKHDPYLVELDRKMDQVNTSYEMSADWLGARFEKIAAERPDDTALAWLEKKNAQLLELYTETMLALTDKLANHMRKKGLLPEDFDKSRHYIGITTSGGVLVTSRITQERQRNCY